MLPPYSYLLFPVPLGEKASAFACDLLGLLLAGGDRDQGPAVAYEGGDSTAALLLAQAAAPSRVLVATSYLNSGRYLSLGSKLVGKPKRPLKFIRLEGARLGEAGVEFANCSEHVRAIMNTSLWRESHAWTPLPRRRGGLRESPFLRTAIENDPIYGSKRS